MSTPALQQQEQLEVLFVRVNKSQRKAINKLVVETKKSLAEVTRELITIGLKAPANLDLLQSIEIILIEHSKTSFEEFGKLREMITHPSGLSVSLPMPEEKPIEGFEAILMPPALEDKKGVFFCQSCGTETPNRKKHVIKVLEEKVVVGDCCYFNDHYKDLIRAIL